MLTRTVAPLLCLLIPACGNEPLAKDPTGKFQIAANCSPETLTKTVSETSSATLVLAFEANNKDIMAATAAAKRATPPFSVVIGGPPDGKEELADAVIVANSGAAAAIDLALLACNGTAPPAKRIEVGLKTITPANRAAGGVSRAGPGDAFLAITRMQHGKMLTTKPETDEMHQVGLLQSRPDKADQQRIRHEVNGAAARYPQLELVTSSNASSVDLTEQAQLMIMQGCRVLLLATSDTQQTQAVVAVAAKAPDGPVSVIVLDPLTQEHGTCVIGCAPETLGQAAAKVVQGLLPEGGSIITCITPSALHPISVISGSRALGFCKAMELPTKKLLGR